MIKYLEGITDKNVLSVCPDIVSFCERGGVGVCALGPFLAYGTAFDFLKAWVQRDTGGDITAFIVKFYGNVTVFTDGTSDDEEIREFLRAIGYSSLLSNDCNVFSDPVGRTGCVMGLDAGALCKADVTTDEFSVIDGETFTVDDYRDFYRVLMKNNPGYVGTSEEDFILDFSHRTRHGISCPVELCVSEEIVSTAAAMCIAPSSVFFGAVSTNENCRGKHYAFTLIRYLCEKYNDKAIYLRCEKSKKAFYEKAGLHFLGEFYAK